MAFVRQGNAAVERVEIGPIPPHRRRPGPASYTVDIPSRAERDGFDTVLIAPVAGDDTYAMGHLLVDGNPATDAELLKRVNTAWSRRTTSAIRSVSLLTAFALPGPPDRPDRQRDALAGAGQ